MESITDNRKLAGVLTYHYGDYGEVPSRGSFLMNALIACHYRSGSWYPVGGPLQISQSIVKVIEKWGGKVLVRAPVSSILTDDKNRAYGVVVKGKVGSLWLEAKAVQVIFNSCQIYLNLFPCSHF